MLLTFTQNSFAQFAAVAGLTPNQTAVAHTIDQIASDPRAAQVLAFLNAEPLGNISGDLNRLGPADLTAVFHLIKSLADIQTANVHRRLEDLRGTDVPDIAVSGGFAGNGRESRSARQRASNTRTCSSTASRRPAPSHR